MRDRAKEAFESRAGGYPTCPGAESNAAGSWTEVSRRPRGVRFKVSALLEPPPLSCVPSRAPVLTAFPIGLNGALCERPDLRVPFR